MNTFKIMNRHFFILKLISSNLSNLVESIYASFEFYRIYVLKKNHEHKKAFMFQWLISQPNITDTPNNYCCSFILNDCATAYCTNLTYEVGNNRVEKYDDRNKLARIWHQFNVYIVYHFASNRSVFHEPDALHRISLSTFLWNTE